MLTLCLLLHHFCQCLDLGPHYNVLKLPVFLPSLCLSTEGRISFNPSNPNANPAILMPYQNLWDRARAITREKYVVPSQTLQAPLQPRENWVLNWDNTSDLLVILFCYKYIRPERLQKKCGWAESPSPSLPISLQFLQVSCKFSSIINNIQHISFTTVAPCKY